MLGHHIASEGFNVAIVGATGAVGHELLTVLAQRAFPVKTLTLLASERSAGSTLRFAGAEIPVHKLEAAAFAGVDVAFFSAGASRSKEFAPIAIEHGAIVVDNSSAFRMHPDVPLVVPEINAEAMNEGGGKGAKLIANPNCVAAIVGVAIAPIEKLSRITRLVMSTYQSASGAGARAMEDLQVQTRDFLDGNEVVPRVLRHPFAFNLFSHDSTIEANGYNGEENKVVAELQKILSRPDLRISATCVRVPVLRAHSASLNLQLADRVELPVIREAIERAAGVRLVDDRDKNHFPMPNEAQERDEVLVGRLREDPSHPTSINLFVAGDQLLKGAALNAVQIAEALAAQGRFQR
ncbi:MAG TPA: aspartate-semialdehyde dehydrogenase [Myxococcota bacterium]|nr:aspartate-semialdehyde dehydrogenase [Myxococcota bacterium]